jgi:DNA polymerase II
VSQVGFIVHASYQTTNRVTRIFFEGRLRTGETFAIVEDRARPSLYVRESDGDRVERVRGLRSHAVERSPFTTVDGEEVLRIVWPNIGDQQGSGRELLLAGVRTYEADIRFYDQFLIDKGVFGSVEIDGEPTRGRRVDWVFHNPEISFSDWLPHLSMLSVDIENNPGSGEILAISLATDTTWRQTRFERVLFLGAGVGDPSVTCYADERSLLLGFRDAVLEIDPDIITGWNVLEFDFLHITERFSFYDIPFVIGRSDQIGNFLPGGKGQSSAVIIPGRQVLDGMRIMRSGPMQFDDNRLDTVAKAVLGSGKVEVSDEVHLTGTKKIDALLRTYRDSPAVFCEYSLKDAILVVDILEKTGLMDLTVRRAQLTGIGLARAWTSVASFEHLYIASMHRQRLVAPTHGVDSFDVKSAPGGAIISPQPGLYENVLVFDFKSLYPSIMRTFNVDPVSFVSSHTHLPNLDVADLIQAPNGAYFRRDQAILPGILEGFFEKREQAKAKDDPVASYVYKIIMNSFYGVLGTSGCRFASSDIAGAITSFGHHFLTWCQRKLQSRGHRVIYGDTDSLFVLLSPTTSADVRSLAKNGSEVASELNDELRRYVRDTWNTESRLDLEFEGIYLRFFMPPTRGSLTSSMAEDGPAQVRGRAKGYAGLRFTGAGDGEIQSVFEIKGLEAVRRDWTDAAKKLQVELMTMTFHDAEIDEIRAYVRAFVADLRSGVYDKDLVYRKALRKPVSAYTKSTPPHVQAAMALEPDERHGVIEYVWTKAGPEPLSEQHHAIDYSHYLEKQLKPVSAALSFTLKADLESLFSSDKQSDLF